MQVGERHSVPDRDPGPHLGPRRREDAVQKIQVLGRVNVETQPDVTAVPVRQKEDPLVVGTGTLHGDEPAHLGRGAHQVIAVAAEPDRSGNPVHPQRYDDPAVLGQLREPRRREVPGTGRHQDRVDPVAELGHAVLSVRADHRDPVRVPGRLQKLAGPVGHLGIDVHADHPARGADDLGEERGVVAAGPDLDHAHPGAEPSLLDHPSLDEGSTDRRDDHVVRGPFDRHRVVGVVGDLQGDALGNEQVPRHGTKRPLHLQGGDHAGHAELVHQRVTDLSRPVRGAGRASHLSQRRSFRAVPPPAPRRRRRKIACALLGCVVTMAHAQARLIPRAGKI